jgi:hypothetical protein
MAAYVWIASDYGCGPMRMIVRHFVPGDIVTRDGTDQQIVIDTNSVNGCCPDAMTVECIKEPPGFVDDDGSVWDPWITLGEREHNLVRRYRYVDLEKERAVLKELGLESLMEAA